jgi:hypothetical protein
VSGTECPARGRSFIVPVRCGRSFELPRALSRWRRWSSFSNDAPQASLYGVCSVRQSCLREELSKYRPIRCEAREL